MNSNPETVSTDYDTCDRLYLEPVTLERVLDVVELERPLGVVVSLGGQTPLGLAAGLAEAGVPCSATRSPRSTLPRIAAASARCSPSSACARRPGASPRRPDEARTIAERDRLPGARAAVVRSRRPRDARRTAPGGARARRARRWSTASSKARSSSTSTCSATARTAGWRRSSSTSSAAGVHSGDSACVLPAPSVGRALETQIRELASKLAAASEHAGCSTSSSRSTR